jgi:manganese-transporting P-type ATPase
MITGDNPLTAVHVAKEVEIVDRDVLILDLPEKSPLSTRTSLNGSLLTTELRWHSIDDKIQIPYTAGDPIDRKIFEEYDICITGSALAKFDPETHKSTIFDLLSHSWVYARVSPSQKVRSYFRSMLRNRNSF